MDSPVFQISLVLGVTVSVALLLRLLKQPLIVAYIFAGVACGPLVFDILHGSRDLYETFSKFGIVLLLFIIGLNLNFGHLRSMGRVALTTGLGQVLFTGIVGALLLRSIGWDWAPAVYLGVAITFSSTIIIMKLLTDKKDEDTVYGRHTIGLMLVQDVIAVALIIGLGTFTRTSAAGGLEIVLILAKLLALGLGLFLASKYALPKLLTSVAGSGELLFLFTLTWCFGMASLVYWLGLSMEIGAIISGIALSSSPYQPEIASRIKPLRDFFLILFFIVLGGEMGSGFTAAAILPAALLSVFILVGNPLILYFLFRLLKFTRRNSFLAGLTAAQVSEFGFVLLVAGRQSGHLSGNEVAVFTIVALTTIFVSSYLISYNENIYRRLLPVFNLFGKDKYLQTETDQHIYDVWVVGYHRIGRRIVEQMRHMGKNFAVIDFDPNAVTKLKAESVPNYFGDVADVEFLESVKIETSQLVILTIPAIDDQINLLNYLQKHHAQTLVVGNAYHAFDAQSLYDHSCDFVMMPHSLGANWIADKLKKLNWNKQEFQKLKHDSGLENLALA